MAGSGSTSGASPGMTAAALTAGLLAMQGTSSLLGGGKTAGAAPIIVDGERIGVDPASIADAVDTCGGESVARALAATLGVAL